MPVDNSLNEKKRKEKKIDNDFHSLAKDDQFDSIDYNRYTVISIVVNRESLIVFGRKTEFPTKIDFFVSIIALILYEIEQ